MHNAYNPNPVSEFCFDDLSRSYHLLTREEKQWKFPFFWICLAESVGAIMKDRVEEILLDANERQLNDVKFLKETIVEVLEHLKTESKMFRATC